MSILLINPPVVKPSEPPAGIAQLAGALRFHGVVCTVLDANVEGLLYLAGKTPATRDTWTKRAIRSRSEHLDALRTGKAFENIDRYKRAVADINRVLQVNAGVPGIRLGLANYQDNGLTPLRSGDLIRAFECPERSPFFSYFRERLPAILDATRSGTVGVSLNYPSQALTAFAMMGYLKTICPGITIILGGGLITSWMKSPAWSDPFRGMVEACVAAAGEGPLLSLLGKEPACGRCAPDYEGFPASDYLSPGFVLPYSASRGCYWHRCSFCPERAEGNAYEPVRPGQAAAELQELVKKTAPVLVHLLDNAVSPALLRSLVQNPPGAPWYGFARISDELTDPDFCRSLKEAGCVMLKLGLESGSQKVLDAMQKGIDLGMAETVLENLRGVGIATYIYLLFGTPTEGPADARQTLDFAVRHRDGIGFLNLAIFNLPAYGPDAEAYGGDPFYEGDLTLYRQFSHPRGWDRGQVRQFLDREFKRHPAIAEILRRDPPLFSSNHAPFFSGIFAGSDGGPSARS